MHHSFMTYYDIFGKYCFLTIDLNVLPQYLVQAMKRIFSIVIILLYGLSSYAQERTQYNFFTQDGDVVWQKVFTTDQDVVAVFTAIKTAGVLTDITETETVLVGSLIERKAEYASLGYSRGSVPIFVNHLLGGFAKIEMRDGRYRVTVNKMYRIDDASPANDRTDFTFYVNKKGQLRLFPERAQEIFDYNFTKMFEVKPQKEEDW